MVRVGLPAEIIILKMGAIEDGAATGLAIEVLDLYYSKTVGCFLRISS